MSLHRAAALAAALLVTAGTGSAVQHPGEVNGGVAARSPRENDVLVDRFMEAVC